MSDIMKRLLPEPVQVEVLRPSRYGSIKGLDDEELANPCELERAVWRQMWGPILRLPAQQCWCGIRPNADEDGGVDWGAFGTVDFARYSGGFDKARYKADKLREERKDLVIRLQIMRERMTDRRYYKVLKLLKMGLIGLSDIKDVDLFHMGRLVLRLRAVKKEIAQLNEARAARKHRRLQAWLDDV